MEYIHSKDIFYLLRDMLKLFDRRPIVHGGKVAYYVYKMLELEGQLEDFELADVVFLMTFHDIGAYKTEDMEQMIKFETKDFRAHSLYGQLFLHYLAPLDEDFAKVITYHHMNHKTFSELRIPNSELVSYLHLAEAIDIYKGSLGEKFSLDIFKKNLGTKFSHEAFDLFCKANQEYHLFEQINSGAYKQEVDELMNFFIMTNKDKEKALQLLMFTLSLKSGIMINRSAICVALCEKLGTLMRLNDTQWKNLVYAAYVHDIGYLAFQKSWIENPEKLSAANMEKFAQHTLLMEQLLKNRIKREVVVIAATHHERADGQGYPRRLAEKQMSISQLILQFSDTIADMMVTPVNQDKVIEKVRLKTNAGWFSTAVTKAFIDNINDITEYAETRSAEILQNLNELDKQYDKIKEANG